MSTGRETRSLKAPTQWYAVRAFAAAILLGALALMTPWASSDGSCIDPLTALFTATSATCVTGLVVVDTGTAFSPFGQGIILLLIQLGGLGIMTLGTFLLVLAGRRLRMRNEFVLMDALGHERVRGLKPLLLRTIGFTLWIEAVGALLLALRFRHAYGYDWGRALAHGSFHSVSAFCNAGFALYETSLVRWQTDPAILVTISFLIVLGGLGFLVLFNLSSIQFWTRDRVQRGRLTLHSRIVLISSGILIVAGVAAIYLLEKEHTLHGLAWPDRLSCALLQSVTARTAGFNAVDMAAVKPATRFLTILMMFIGGSPASTAGGVKTTTMVVLILTVYAMITSREDTEALHRTIPAKIVREAISIFMLGILCVVVFFTALLITEDAALLSLDLVTPYDIFFETVSAFGTVGLSTGVTPQLSSAGRLLVVVCMFIGRLGPLTLALVIGTRDTRTSPIRYPEEEVVVG